MIDVLVAGAGPVGLAVAIMAASSGLDVQVVDPRSSPIDKACGEGLMPDALDRLLGMGIDPPGEDFVGIRYIGPGHSARANFKHGPGRGVRRTVLQEMMRLRAVEMGVAFASDRITAVEQRKGTVRAGKWSARYLVGADGLHSHVRASLGISAVAGAWPRYGIRQHFDIEPWADVVEVYWLPDAELYVTPVDSHTVGVAVLGSAPLDLDRAIASVPALAWRLKSQAPTSAARGAGPMRVTVAERRRGNALLVGDAAGYVDALTGEGLRIGFAQAQAAVDCVRANALDGYEREWSRITRSYRLLTTTLLHAAQRPRLRGSIVPAARALPFVFTRIVNAL